MSNEKNKVMSLHDAIAKYVHDGDHIVLGGFVTHRRPVAAAYEIIRQGIKDLVYESAGGAMDGALPAKTYFASFLRFCWNPTWQTPVTLRYAAGCGPQSKKAN